MRNKQWAKSPLFYFSELENFGNGRKFGPH
jgi:hypothetical protein